MIKFKFIFGDLTNATKEEVLEDALRFLLAIHMGNVEEHDWNDSGGLNS